MRVVDHCGSRPEFVVFGGLVPEMLCSASEFQHAGTTDVDGRPCCQGTVPVRLTSNLVGSTGSMASKRPSRELENHSSRRGEVLGASQSKVVPQGTTSTLDIASELLGVAVDLRIGWRCDGAAPPECRSRLMLFRDGPTWFDFDMPDERISLYRRAMEEMIRGHYQVEMRSDGDGDVDDVGRLGESISRLGGVLERRYTELCTLLEVTEKINSGLVLDEVLDHIYEEFGAFIPYNRIGCALIDLDGGLVRSRWARSDNDALHILPGYAAVLQGSSLHKVIETGEPRIINDLEAYLREHPDSDATQKIVAEGMRSSLTCPLTAFSRRVGFLFFSSRKVGAYADAHIDSFRQVAAQVSVIVEKGRVYQELLDTQDALRNANKRLAALANIDGLTGVANRRRFDEQLDSEWRRASRYHLPLSAILVDVDQFKRYNDTHGHLAGDDCLKAIAQALRSTLNRGSDFLARYGGEEFVVLLGHTTPVDAITVAERLRKRVAELRVAEDVVPGGVAVTISLGVAGMVPTRETEAHVLVDRADHALYQAKAQGRNRVQLGE